MKTDDKPTGQLRFMHDPGLGRLYTLQQEFLTWDEQGIRLVWRDVPTVMAGAEAPKVNPS